MAVNFIKVSKPKPTTVEVESLVGKPKVKVKSKSTAKQEPSKTADLVDKIITANAAIVAAKEPAKQQAKARKELLSMVEDLFGAEEEIIVAGSLGKIKFTPMSNTRSVTDMKAIHKMLGDDAFYQLATIALGNIDAYLTPAQQAKVISSGKGARGMSILPNDAAAEGVAHGE